MRKIAVWMLALCLALAVTAPALAEEAAAQGQYVMAGFDGDNSYHDWNTHLFFKRMTEQTGVTFTFRQYTEYDKWTEAKAQMLAGGSVPDVMFKAELTQREIAAFHEKGLLLDLAPLLETNAPNLYALIQGDENLRAAITQPDGAIVTLPSINELPSNNAMWINRQWLETLGLEAPTDKDTLRAVLEAFRDRDPNGNGKKDEIPLSFLGVWDLKFLGHAFGLIANDYNVFVDDAGQAQYLASQPEFRSFVAWLRDLYRDGLLAKDGFTTADTLRQVTDEKAAVTYGMLLGTTPLNLLPYGGSGAYQVLMPLYFNGRQIYRDLVGTVYPGAYAISAACKEPEKLLAWVDILYTQEGGLLASVGQEGADYEIDPEDGTWDWIGDISSNGQRLMQEVTICDSGNMPWRYPVAFQLKYARKDSVSQLSELYALREYCRLPYPIVTLSAADSQRVNTLQYELGKYLDTAMSRFIIGEVELTDESWQIFQDTLREKGLDEFMSIWQNAL